jgi:hypothetical protein
MSGDVESGRGRQTAYTFEILAVVCKPALKDELLELMPLRAEDYDELYAVPRQRFRSRKK